MTSPHTHRSALRLGGVATSDVLLLVVVAALWGASFLFIRVAVHDFGPVALMEARVALAGLALFGVVAVLRQRPAWRQRRRYLVLGALSAAAPFTLIAAAELYITASLAAILNATTPLFALLLSVVWLREPLTRRRLSGVLLGVLGVGVLVGLGPVTFTVPLVAAVAASLLAALLYAAGGIYAKTHFTATAPITVATGQQLAAAALLLIPATLLPPSRVPGVHVAGAVCALAIASTAVGFVLFYHLVHRIGPTGALSVTFLVPVFGSAWGWLFLNEPITLGTALGLLIVLASVALVTDTTVRRPARFTPLKR